MTKNDPKQYLGEMPTPHVYIQSPTQMTQRSLLTIFLVAGLCLSIALGFLLYSTLHLTHELLVNRTTGYANRSVACASLATQVGRQALPLTCTDPRVEAFYNPNQVAVAIAKSTAATNILGLRNRALTCEGQYVQGIRFRKDSPCLTSAVRTYWNPAHLTSYRSK